jgi:hypothetical protein
VSSLGVLSDHLRDFPFAPGVISAELDAQPPNAAHNTAIARSFRMAVPLDPAQRNCFAHRLVATKILMNIEFQRRQ